MTKQPPYSKELIQYRMERARDTLSTAQLLLNQNADTAALSSVPITPCFTPRLPSLRPSERKLRNTAACWRCSTDTSLRQVFCRKKWGNSCTPPLTRVKQGITKTNWKSHVQWRNGWWISPFGLSIPSRKNFEISCDVEVSLLSCVNKRPPRFADSEAFDSNKHV